MYEFQPRILPEASPPDGITACRRCELWRQRKRVVWGEGNPEAPIFVVLDNPGAREDKDGRPFLCGTRETLQKAAYEGGLSPDQYFVSYILKCRPVRAYDKPVCREICLSYLWEQIDGVKPDISMVLGDTAVQSLLGDAEASVKALRGTVRNIRGYPTVVSYHPLAVRRRPTLYKIFVEDWAFAAELLKGSALFR